MPWIPDVTDTRPCWHACPQGCGPTSHRVAFGEASSSLRLLGPDLPRWEGGGRLLTTSSSALGHLDGTSWVRPSSPPEGEPPAVPHATWRRLSGRRRTVTVGASRFSRALTSVTAHQRRSLSDRADGSVAINPYAAATSAACTASLRLRAVGTAGLDDDSASLRQLGLGTRR